jgi:hypothetical protein
VPLSNPWFGRAPPAGHCLESDPICTKIIKTQIETLESYAFGDTSRKKRLVAALRTRLEQSLASAADKSAVRLERQVRDAVDLHGKGSPLWLASYIERVVLSGLPSPDAYRVFEARVLASYRCPVTGRFPPGLTRPC